MNKKKLIFDIMYVILIISVIYFMFWVVSYMKNNTAECIKNPISYFELKNEGAFCSCYKDGIPFRPTDFGEGNI